MNSSSHTIEEHFENRPPEVKATYRAILKAARQLGPVKEEAKKTSIHLVRKSAFAGVATRKSALILTLKSDADVASKRVGKGNTSPPIAGTLKSSLKPRNRSIARSAPGSTEPNELAG